MGTRFVAAGILLGALMLGGDHGATAVAQTGAGSRLVVAFIAVVPALVTPGPLPYGAQPARLEAAGIALGVGGVLLLAGRATSQSR